MQAKERREEILKILRGSERPVSASVIARRLGVSRQIIVGDVALMRAGGEQITATPRGYMLSPKTEGNIRRIACRHDAKQMREELYIIVDHGCEIRDVIVEHPVYGELTGSLQLTNRYDVDQFIEKSLQSEALPLSILTEGVHLHTIVCPDDETYDRVCRKLQEKDLLYI